MRKACCGSAHLSQAIAVPPTGERFVVTDYLSPPRLWPARLWKRFAMCLANVLPWVRARGAHCKTVCTRAMSKPMSVPLARVLRCGKTFGRATGGKVALPRDRRHLRGSSGGSGVSPLQKANGHLARCGCARAQPLVHPPPLALARFTGSHPGRLRGGSRGGCRSSRGCRSSD